MRNINVIMLVAFTSLLSCSKPDNNQEQPGDKPNDKPSEITYTTTASIGIDGGKLTDVTIQVDIPQGAFSKSQTMELKKSTEGSAFGEYESSTFYEVKGIPANFSKPIKVTITPASGSPDNLLMTVMEDKYSPSLRQLVQSSNFVSATKSGSSYVCDLNPYSVTGTLRDTTISLKFGLVKNYELLPATKAGSNFKMYAPKEYKPLAFDLRDYLDQIYYTVRDDLQFSYAERTTWPMEVTVKKFPAGKQNVFGYFVMSSWSHNYSNMEFNASLLTSTTEIKATAGHEFLHFAKSLYGTMSTVAMLVSNDPFYWLDEASSVWFEEIASGQPGYNPLTRQGHHLEPLVGVYKGAEQNAEHYGYGMSAFIKYLINTNDNTSLVKMYNLIRDKSVSNPVEAINQSHAKSFEEVYPSFLQDYFSGKIYSDFQSSSLLSNSTEAFNIQADTDTLKTIIKDYEALSAQIFRVEFSYAGLTKDDALSIYSSGLSPMLIYQADITGLHYLGKAYDEFIVSDLKDLKDKTAKILVVKPNTSLTKDKQTVEFRVEKGLAIDAVWAKLYVRGSFTGDVISSASVEVPLEVRSDDWPNYPMLKATYSNATKILTASYNGNSLTINFDLKAKKISGSVSFQNNDVSFVNRTVTATANFSGIPLTEWDGKLLSQYQSTNPKGSVTVLNCEYAVTEIEKNTLITPSEVSLWIYFGKRK